MGKLESTKEHEITGVSLSEDKKTLTILVKGKVKSGTGQTLLEYHNALRCEKAKDLLRTTDMGISEIGEAVGFVSSAHFSHVFRKITGCTPTSYRESSKDAE